MRDEFGHDDSFGSNHSGGGYATGEPDDGGSGFGGAFSLYHPGDDGGAGDGDALEQRPGKPDFQVSSDGNLIELRPCPKEHLDLAWPHILPLVEKLERHTDGVRTAASLYNEVASGAAELWIVHDVAKDAAAALVVTMEMEDGRGRVSGMIVDAVGKEKGAWVALVRDGFEELFRNRGYYKYMIMGRRGWARDLRDFEAKTWIFERAL